MPSSISVVRRRVGLVDLTVRQRTGVTGFRFSAASNFDGSFTAFQTVPNYGLRSLSVQTKNEAIGDQFRGQCRFVFSPLDYTASFPAVRDDIPFYVRIEPQNADGTFGPAEAMQIVLPYDTAPNPAVILHGIATGVIPSAAVEINLPGLCNDFTIRNVSTGANLFVSFAHGTATGAAGPEYLIGPVGILEMDYANASRLFVRGGTAAAAEMYAVFTRKTQPLNL